MSPGTPGRNVESKRWPIVKPIIIKRVIVHRRWRRYVNRIRHIPRRRLVHVEINSLRNSVLRTQHSSRLEQPCLNILVGSRSRRQSANFEIIGTKIVECSIGISENFQVQRRFANDFAVRLNSSARGRSLNHDIESHRSVRPRLSAWRQWSGAAREKHRRSDNSDTCQDSLHKKISLTN